MYINKDRNRVVVPPCEFSEFLHKHSSIPEFRSSSRLSVIWYIFLLKINLLILIHLTLIFLSRFIRPWLLFVLPDDGCLFSLTRDPDCGRKTGKKKRRVVYGCNMDGSFVFIREKTQELVTSHVIRRAYSIVMINDDSRWVDTSLLPSLSDHLTLYQSGVNGSKSAIMEDALFTGIVNFSLV